MIRPLLSAFTPTLILVDIVTCQDKLISEQISENLPLVQFQGMCLIYPIHILFGALTP